jgi:uncharacterized protein YhfF
MNSPTLYNDHTPAVADKIISNQLQEIEGDRIHREWKKSHQEYFRKLKNSEVS